MALKDIAQKIYKSKKIRENKPKFLKTPLEKPFQEPNVPLIGKKGILGGKIKNLFSSKKNKIIFTCLIIALIVLSFISFYIYQRGKLSFDIEDVVLEIKSKEEIISGQEIVYTIYYVNNTNVSLKNAEIILQYPEGFLASEKKPSLSEKINFKTWQIGEIKSGARKTLEIKGRLIGEKNSIKYARVKMRFNPVNFSSIFEKNAEMATTIIDIPLALTLKAPKTVSSGGTVSYILEYSVKKDLSPGNLKLTFEYPEGFTLNDLNPQPSEFNNVWNIKEISQEAQPGRIEVSGTLSGKENEVKILKVIVEAINEGENSIKYAEESSEIRIASSPLIIWQTVNGKSEYSANCSEKMEFVINYKNTSDIGLRRAIITSEFSKESEKVLDMSTLKVHKGFYDADKKSIIWTAAGVPELGVLEPGESGSVSFKIKIKDRLPIDNFSSKNFTIKNIARIDSPDIPTQSGVNKIIASNEILVKINSKLVLSVKGYYNDDGRIENTGPIPPKVGQTTTYTIHWQILNLTNDIKNVEVKSTIPTWVVWTGETIEKDNELQCDERTGSIVWQVGDLAANTGILSPLKEVVFQVSIKPNITQKDQLVRLLEETKITGRDTFTGAILEGKISPLYTDLPDDPSISEKEGRVVE